MKRLSIVAAAGVALLSLSTLGTATANAAEANIFTLDFEFDDDGNALVAGDGTNIDEQWADWGVHLSTDDPGDHPLRLFNSNCGPNFPVACTGRDNDLASGPSFDTDPLGNVLIVQENANSNNPDDYAFGGLITFTFDEEVLIDTIGILDFDDRDRGEGFIRAFTDDTNFIELTMSSDGTLLNPPFQGNNSLREYSFGPTLVTKLEVDFPGSGAVAYLDFIDSDSGGNDDVEVPEPASTLGLFALGALGATRLLKRKEQ